MLRRYLEGGTLRDALDNRGRLTEQEVRVVACRLLTAAEGLHGAGMAHMDLKPDNCAVLRAGAAWETTTVFDMGSWKPTAGACHRAVLVA